MEKANAQQIANTIIQQLGGGRFKVMTGAKNFSYGSDGELNFRFPRQKGLMYCRITITPMDTYDMEFLNCKGDIKKSFDGIYFDQLQELFTKATGLYTHL